MIMDNIHSDHRSITLELLNSNPNPIRLYRGVPIGMISFLPLTGKIEQESSKQYGGQLEATEIKKGIS